MRNFICAVFFGFSCFFNIGTVLFYKPYAKVVNSIHYERCEKCKIETKEDKEFIDLLLSDPVAAFTALLFFATVFLAIVTMWLYIEAKNTGKEQVAASKDAALQAQRSAIAAESAIQAANISSERQLRAYVNNVSGTIQKVEVGKIVEARIEIKNWGQTPAYKFRHRTRYALEHYPWKDSLPYELHKSESTLGPGANNFILIKSARIITEGDFDGIHDGRFAIYIMGNITYTDAFGRDRFTNYRFFVGGERGFPPEYALFSDVFGNDAN